jgi:hypothetical protein
MLYTLGPPGLGFSGQLQVLSNLFQIALPKIFLHAAMLIEAAGWGCRWSRLVEVDR